MRKVKLSNVAEVATQDTADTPQDLHRNRFILPKFSHGICRQPYARLQVNSFHVPVDEHLPEFLVTDIHFDHH